MLCCVYSDKQWNWEAVLPQIEFAYDSMVNRSIDKTKFEIVYISSPYYVCDLAIMPTVAMVGESKTANNAAQKALKIQVVVQAHLKATNAKYNAKAEKIHCKKVLLKCDLVMKYLQRSQFLGICTKLERHKYSPF